MITIDGWRRLNGAGCEHIEIRATVEGRAVTLRSTLSDLRELATTEREVRQAILVLAGLRRRAGLVLEGPVV